MIEPRKHANDQLRVLIVDDHPLMRESLRRTMQQEPGFTVCGEAEDRLDALEVVDHCHPHLALVDLTLKSSSGLELVKDISSRHQDIKMLVLSMHDETLLAERVIRAGAHGYITKQEPPAKILEAIHRVLAGEIYLSEHAALCVASRVAVRNDSDGNVPATVLTDREMEVFELIGTGKSTRQIAATLQIGVSTVETYRNRIKQKLRLKDGAELLQSAITLSKGRSFGATPFVR